MLNNLHQMQVGLTTYIRKLSCPAIILGACARSQLNLVFTLLPGEVIVCITHGINTLAKWLGPISALFDNKQNSKHIKMQHTEYVIGH